jgi:hypothetical protein
MAIKVYKTHFVTGEPIEYIVSSTDGVIPAGGLSQVNGSQNGLMAATMSSSASLALASYFTNLSATTGSTAKPYPVSRLDPNFFYKVDHSTAEAVIGTTALNYMCLVSSSGAATVASTGSFKITEIYNTSDTSAQFFIGKFILRNSTVV